MPSITLGAKIPLVSSSDMLEGLLPDTPFAFVEVPKLSTRNHLLEIRGGWLGATQVCGKMSAQGRFQTLDFSRFHRAQDRVRSETGNLSTDITNGCVHRIREGLAGVTANDQGSLLRHKSGHVPATSGNNDFAALHRNAEPGSRIAVNHDSSAAQSRRRPTARVASNHDGPAQHRLR